jgi:molecular chaperone Hsp33
MQRYQGIVELTGGSSLEDVAEGYFRQSEQIPTTVRLAVARIARRSDGGGFVEGWRAGGLIAQFLPEAPERMRMPDLPGGDAPEGAEDVAGFEDDDAWTEVKALVETVHDSELADPDVGVERLLFRLFHERGVRVFPATPVIDDCSCSRERIKDVLSNFSAEEIADSVEDGRIAVTCEFCGEHYDFAPEEFAKD